MPSLYAVDIRRLDGLATIATKVMVAHVVYHDEYVGHFRAVASIKG